MFDKSFLEDAKSSALAVIYSFGIIIGISVSFSYIGYLYQAAQEQNIKEQVNERKSRTY